MSAANTRRGGGYFLPNSNTIIWYHEHDNAAAVVVPNPLQVQTYPNTGDNFLIEFHLVTYNHDWIRFESTITFSIQDEEQSPTTLTTAIFDHMSLRTRIPTQVINHLAPRLWSFARGVTPLSNGVANANVRPFVMDIRLGWDSYVDTSPPAIRNKYNVDSLEKVIKLSERDSADCCSICSSEFTGVCSEVKLTVVRLPCSHIFHGDCIVKWLNRIQNCPICRFVMP